MPSLGPVSVLGHRAHLILCVIRNVPFSGYPFLLWNKRRVRKKGRKRGGRRKGRKRRSKGKKKEREQRQRDCSATWDPHSVVFLANGYKKAPKGRYWSFTS